MKIPNGFFGNGPGRDEQNTRDQEAYLRNRMQMTVATSTFAGVALVGMFCSCIWFACCRNSSSKTRKKARTWATANPEAGSQNPYSYDGYMDAHGYMQMNNNTEGVAPYMNPPSSMYGETGLTNPYDFNDHFGFNQGGKAQMSTLFGGPASTYPTGVTGTTEANLKDVPPSYTALFFAASDPSTGMNKAGGVTGETQSSITDPRITSIQPIHLKVTSSTEQQRQQRAAEEARTVNSGNQGKYREMEDDDIDDDFVNMKQDRSAGPVSLLSVESDPGKSGNDDEDKKSNGHDKDKKSESGRDQIYHAQEKPPPYNPGYNNNNMSYMKF